ncbi:MAG: hypothetical protein PHD60_06610 [Clostridia bacterium]|nr:hypothetical protein [Clostridia bacterium]
MKKELTPERKKERALAYLMGKYGEKFAPISMSQSGWGQGYDKLYFYPIKGSKDKDTFALWGTMRDDRRYAMHDGYFGIIIKDKYEAVMSGFVKEIYKEFKLYTNIDRNIVHPDRLNKNTKISEIYNSEEHFISYTTIFLKCSSAEGIDTSKSLKTIAKKMKENKLVGKVTIYIAFDNKFESVDYDILDKDTREFFVRGSRRYIWVNPNLEIDEVE